MAAVLKRKKNRDSLFSLDRMAAGVRQGKSHDSALAPALGTAQAAPEAEVLAAMRLVVTHKNLPLNNESKKAWSKAIAG